MSSQDSVEEEQNGKEAVPKVSTSKPARVSFPDDLSVMQVDCGTFHTGEPSTLTCTFATRVMQSIYMQQAVIVQTVV